jgi:hypothetical protein
MNTKLKKLTKPLSVTVGDKTITGSLVISMNAEIFTGAGGTPADERLVQVHAIDAYINSKCVWSSHNLYSEKNIEDEASRGEIWMLNKMKELATEESEESDFIAKLRSQGYTAFYG